ncbi:protein-disulfide reductase DsbD family protein [Cognatiluteimonas weifangensis]|uniref:protein-disulfide reductase DsbD family protein n=1 Tax=Cognatiluteimonas weifangensis TaxID=2303539 RepID=UPI003608DE00
MSLSLRRPLAAWWACAALLCFAVGGVAGSGPARAAVSEADLLPVDQAFALTATAPERGRIVLHWKIAPGYYLYRHRLAVQSLDADFRTAAAQVPHGARHHDEFFGEVETFRGQLAVIQPGSAAAGARQATLKVKYQGCADVGVCYPPQTRTLTVALPAAAAGPGPAGLGALGGAGRGRGLLPGGAAAGPGEPLPPAQAFGFDAIVGDGNTLLLRFTPAPGYYLYRDRSSFRVDGAAGIAAATPRWPRGTQYHDEYFGDVVVYFDQVEVPLPLRRSRADAAEVRLTATFQGCQTGGICYPPMTRTTTLALPAGTLGTTAAAAPATVAATAAPAPTSASASADIAPMPASAAGVDAALAPTTAPLPAQVPRTAPPPEALAAAGAAGAATPGLLLALLLALAGGLILNLMPCVLPVLTLKALSLATSGGRARAHALWYTAGVLLSFLLVGALVLGLRSTGQALGWGFQLQQPWVVGALAYVMFAVGLGLSGLISVGHGLAGAGQGLAARDGAVGDFFTGVLAVVVASPCTAPFMAAALAFAFTASPLLALAVFAALGLGLALPFLLIGFVPALARRLPRPGPWMDTLKQVLAFPMYLTAVWLLWVLGQQRGIDAVGLALTGMVLLALAAWWLARLRLRRAPLQRTLALALLLAATAPLALAARLPAPVATTAGATAVVPYSAQRLAQLRSEGRVVFVDMTADWCVTCKANEKTVLSRARFREAMRRADAVFMQGDWTNVDPEITAFLEAHRAVGVPLYVVFPRDGGAGEVLPTVLTSRLVEDALRRAAQ